MAKPVLLDKARGVVWRRDEQVRAEAARVEAARRVVLAEGGKVRGQGDKGKLIGAYKHYPVTSPLPHSLSATPIV